jgi:curved DNA-binding protein CbpA
VLDVTEIPGGGDAVNDDPFALLGLPTRAGLSDDDVRAAWRRVAAATHPDRDDGGDPARFGAAAAAYAMLRTAYGRGEALADLAMGGTEPPARSGSGSGSGHFRNVRRAFGEGAGVRGRRGGADRHDGTDRSGGQRHGGGRRIGGAGRHAGRIGALAMRCAAAAAVAALALLVAGWAPSSIGVIAGVLTWLFATARHDLTRAARR